jgi:DNA-binding MarR family transcriptional regulator
MDAAPDPELAELAGLIREGIGRLNWRMRAEREHNGPGPLVLAVLSRLCRAGTHTPKALAEAERVQLQSLTRVLGSLHERGLISRRPDPAVGRQSLVDITGEGLALLRGYSEDRERWLAESISETLSHTERELLRLAAELMIRVADR